MFGLVLFGVAAMGTSLIIQPPIGALPRAGHGATALMPYVRRLCPPSARRSIVAIQLRYATGPLTSPCGWYGPYWLSGPGHCRTGDRDEEPTLFRRCRAPPCALSLAFASPDAYGVLVGPQITEDLVAVGDGVDHVALFLEAAFGHSSQGWCRPQP